MKEKRTIQTVQKSIAAFFRENRWMPFFAERAGLLGVRSRNVVNFWSDTLIEAKILEAANHQYPIIRPKTELKRGALQPRQSGRTMSDNIQDLQAFCR